MKIRYYSNNKLFDIWYRFVFWLNGKLSRYCGKLVHDATVKYVVNYKEPPK